MDNDNKVARLERALEIYADDGLNFAKGMADPACMSDFIRNVRFIIRELPHVHVSTHRQEHGDPCRACGLDLRDDIHDISCGGAKEPPHQKKPECASIVVKRFQYPTLCEKSERPMA